jgi:DNA-binding LacI/PurR family transcriptional regulator
MAKISDIAKALGLSNATISKALNGSPEIPQTTVDRVK